MEEKTSDALYLRREFLIGFIRSVISETEIRRRKELPFDKEKLLNKLLKMRNENGIKDELESELEKPDAKNLSLRSKPEPAHPKLLPKMRKIPLKRMPFMPPIRHQMPPKYSGLAIRPGPAVPEQITISSMGKINSLLNDPAVQMIECLGPEKQILVYKSGVIQNTNIVLNNEEINLLMKELSEKTKIPLISGVFKTALGNMVITAVISDFIGTRFMIQRKTSAPV